MKHQTNGAWFVPIRGSYLPCSWQGWLLYLPFVGLLAATGIGTALVHQRVVYAVLQVAGEWLLITAGLTWLAARHALPQPARAGRSARAKTQTHTKKR